MKVSVFALAATLSLAAADNLSDAVNALSLIADTDTAAYDSWLKSLIGQLSATATATSGGSAASFSIPTLDLSLSAALHSLTAALGSGASGSSGSAGAASKTGSSSAAESTSSGESSSSSSAGATGPVLAGGALFAVLGGLLM